MLQRGIIKSIRTASREYRPEDAGLLIAVEGGRATDFIIHHKRDVARGVREKLLSGAWPGQRPVGYIYDHDLRNIVPDPKYAKVVRAIYEEFSLGRVGLVGVSERLCFSKRPPSRSKKYQCRGKAQDSGLNLLWKS